MAVFAHQLLEFLDILKLEEPVLIGNSMGAAVAARVALLHPRRVSGLILVDPAPLIPPKGWQQIARFVGQELKGGRPSRPLVRPKILPTLSEGKITRQSVDAFLKAAFHDPGRVTADMVEVYFQPLASDGATEALAALLDPPFDPSAEVLPPWGALRVPVLVIWGKHDRILPFWLADAYVKAIPAARLLVFENSGHLPQEEESEAFNARVTEFAAQLERVTTPAPPRASKSLNGQG
jgi:pimeloyl-ACP methyl ester carboxylesterase